MLKLPYFNRWLKKLCGNVKSAKYDPVPSRIAWRVQTPEELKNVPENFILLIFGTNGVENILENGFPHKLSPELLYWLAPKNEVALQIPFTAGESPCRVEAVLELEPEVSLEWLVKSRNVLEERELVALVAGELSSLLKSVEWSQESFDDEFENEQLRAKLSLRLMEKGFRCNGLTSFALHVPQEQDEMPGGIAAETDAVNEPEESDFVQEEMVMEELQAFLGQESQDWDELRRQFMESDLTITPEESQELESLLEDRRQNRFLLERTSRKILQMAGEKAAEAGAEPPDLDRWSNMETRRRVRDMEVEFEADFQANANVADPDLAPFRREEPAETPDKGRVDSQLRQAMESSLKTSRMLYARLRESLELIIHMAEVRRLDRELQAVEDMLQTLPALVPAEESLRYHDADIRGMLDALKQGNGYASQIERFARQLHEVSPGSQDWKKTVNDTREAICRLSGAVGSRRRVSN